MLVGSTLPLLVYLMAQEIQSDKRISLAASMLMAFNPSMIELACEIQRDMLYIGLCGWAVFFGLKGLMQKKLWPWIPAGMLGALSALTRYETFEMFPVLLMAFLIFGLKKGIPWERICQQVAIFAAALIITGIGMIFLMGIQDFVIDSYSKYFQGKMTLLESHVAPGETR
ncbi:MAG: glycosyltransferase family 39 protein [Lentisphaeria bacterium]|nr:glycosyltransferase family 39 protein [Lentisphaeria bacterium]